MGQEGFFVWKTLFIPLLPITYRLMVVHLMKHVAWQPLLVYYSDTGHIIKFLQVGWRSGTGDSNKLQQLDLK